MRNSPFPDRSNALKDRFVAFLFCKVPLGRPRVVAKAAHGAGWYVSQSDRAERDGHVGKRTLGDGPASQTRG
ncbi:hypothetical protein ACKVWC_011544 [Pyricularia oryzae]